MLVLTRKVGEDIIIGDNIVLTISEVKGDSVRLAIDAPKEIKIYRGEIYKAIAGENKKATELADIVKLDVLKTLSPKEK